MYRNEIIYSKIYQILPDPCDIYGFKRLEGFVRNTAETLESESWWKQMPEGARTHGTRGSVKVVLYIKGLDGFTQLRKRGYRRLYWGLISSAPARDYPNNRVYNKVLRKYESKYSVMNAPIGHEAPTLISRSLYRQFWYENVMSRGITEYWSSYVSLRAAPSSVYRPSRWSSPPFLSLFILPRERSFSIAQKTNPFLRLFPLTAAKWSMKWFTFREKKSSPQRIRTAH